MQASTAPMSASAQNCAPTWTAPLPASPRSRADLRRARHGGDGPWREEDKGQGEGEADKGVREDIPLEPRAAALAQQRLEPLLRARALEAAVETHHVGEHEVQRVHEREGEVGGRQPVRPGDKEGEHHEQAGIALGREAKDVALHSELMLHVVACKVEDPSAEQLGRGHAGSARHWARGVADSAEPVHRSVYVQRIGARQQQPQTAHRHGP